MDYNDDSQVIDYVTVRVSLSESSDGSELSLHWLFPDGRDTWTRLSTADILKWKTETLAYEKRTRGISVCAGPHPETGRNFLDRIGKELYQKIFVGKVISLWNGLKEVQAIKPLRIEFTMSDIAEQDGRLADELEKHRRRQMECITSIPFEAIKSENPRELQNVIGPFVLSPCISVVRKVSLGPGIHTEPLEVSLPVRFLVVAPIPKDIPREWALDCNKEIEHIQEAIKPLGGRLAMDLLGPLGDMPATAENLNRIASQYHVIHFITHGRIEDKGQSQLLLETDAGLRDWRNVEGIVQNLLNSKVRLLVLNGCRTAAIADLACRFPAVVGMQFHISDQAAIDFAAGFYMQLATTGQLDDSVMAGRKKIHEGPPDSRWEFRHPVLFTGCETGLIFKISPMIETQELPFAKYARDYSTRLYVRGGRQPYTWSIDGLPDGLSFDPTTGCISGKPSVCGEFPVSIAVRSRDGLGDRKDFIFTIEGSELEIMTEQIG